MRFRIDNDAAELGVEVKNVTEHVSQFQRARELRSMTTGMRRPECSTLTTIVTPAVVCAPNLPSLAEPILGRLGLKDVKSGTLYGSLSGYGPPNDAIYSTKKHELQKVLWYEIDFGESIELRGVALQKPGTHMTLTDTANYGILKTFTLELDGAPVLDPLPDPMAESVVVNSATASGVTLPSGFIAKGGRYRVCTCSLRAHSRRVGKAGKAVNPFTYDAQLYD
ncbi:unnamed protein product [Amoebophrya sp. A25]|nr:unnamed protein product [Amoebophrya sp. A25]|eukprot:GSA25T00027999001.1